MARIWMGRHRVFLWFLVAGLTFCCCLFLVLQRSAVAVESQRGGAHCECPAPECPPVGNADGNCSPPVAVEIPTGSGECVEELKKTFHRAMSAEAALEQERAQKLEEQGRTGGYRSEEEKKDFEEAEKLFRDRITRLQSPADCSKARFYFCDISEYKCGFGCQLHGLMRCVTFTYKSGLTAELWHDKMSRYSDPWSHFFEPLSTCKNWLDENPSWEGKTSAWHENDNSPGPRYYTRGGPAPSYYVDPDIEPLVKKWHRDPPLWMFGHIGSHVWRLNSRMTQVVDETRVSIGLGAGKSPDYALHIRRTDKLLSEAWFHDLGEYMYPIDRWRNPSVNYRSAYGKKSGKSVFVATDEPSVFAGFKHHEAYTFAYNERGAKAAGVGDRQSSGGMEGLCIDVQLMSEASYFVGTFSSQLSRFVYELLAARVAHPYLISESLDEGWYIGS